MKILILSSASLHFPLDIQDSLKEAGLESHRLRSLNEFIASPLRKEPFLAILEVGSTEDIDRALVAYEWAETVQPLAVGRYLLLVGSKHISLQEKANRFRGVEIAQLPLPTKNLLFKVELQLKVLSKESNSKIQRKPDGFTAEIREVERERVMVIRGMGPKEGGWKNSGDAPQGRTRWRWIDDPPKKGKPEEKLSWSTESKAAPVFNSEIDGWEVGDAEGDLQCHLQGEEIFSAKKAGMEGESTGKKAVAFQDPPSAMTPTGKAVVQPGATEPKPATKSVEGAGTDEKSKPAKIEATTTAARNQRADSPATPSGKAPAATTITGEKLSGANPLKPQAPSEPAAKASGNTPSPALPEREKAPATHNPVPKTAAPARENSSGTGMELPKLGEAKPHATGAALPELGGKKPVSPQAEASPTPASRRTGHVANTAANLALGDPARKEEAEASPSPASNVPRVSAPPATAQEPGAPAERTSTAPANHAPSHHEHPEPSSATANPPNSAPEIPALDAGRARETPKQSIPTLGSRHSRPEKDGLASTQAQTAEPKNPTATEIAPAHSKTVKTEVLHSQQEHPAGRGADSKVEFPEQTREITGKVVIPTGPAHSDHQNLVRSGAARDSSSRNVVSSQAGEKSEAQHLKARHFLRLSLEELQDQNSTWLPVEGYRIYLSARHRYYGLRDLNEIFPLWVYEGELAPEFLDQQRSWKFYDRLPVSHISLASLPPPIVRYLTELKGARAKEADARVEAPQSAEERPEEKDPAPGLSAALVAGARKETELGLPDEVDVRRRGILSMLRRLLGLKD